MFVLLLGFPVLKLILIPLLKQLSFNTPKTDHYPPKVEKARSLFVTQAISYLLVFPHFLLLQRAEMGKLQRTQQSGVLATAAATAVKQAMGVLGSQEPDMLPEGRERGQGCLCGGGGVGQIWSVLFGGAGLVLKTLEPSCLHCSPRNIAVLVE